MVADRNIVGAPPATTMVEQAERVDLVYGVSEAVKVEDGSLIPTEAGAGTSKQEGTVNVISWSMQIIVGMGLLVMVTVYVAETVFVLSQNKSPNNLFTPAPVAFSPDIIISITPAPVVPVTPAPTTPLHTLPPTPPSTARPTTPPIAPIPTPDQADLQLICAWLDLSLTMCPTETRAVLPIATAMGSIPSQIGLLTSLTDLDLFNNALSGSIPSQIVLLTSLTDLDLSMNALTGSIPSQIGLLTSLTGLGLSTIALTGSIPSQIGLLTGLTGLDLSMNALTGSIPSQIGLLTSLKLLALSPNALTGSIPSQIGLLKSLTLLCLDGNELTGSIPSSLCNEGAYVIIDCETITKCSCCGCHQFVH
jgi:hypothetical protein